ncbi:hypothetical protein BDZ85DRAFT_283768 [Elsinoe ampelina]|uniref:Wax synthase domain-containing protein n=1 Tax=Elsinoe ampelina TaxID=302913 RepID=A0A6A6G586_9PEZI|nr:hypothetical protein BDZ85DRAFT_283768 [Elsinoe ampelina]
MGAVDVISMDALLWSIYLLGIKDPRKDFVYLSQRTNQVGPHTSQPPHEKDDSPKIPDQPLTYHNLLYDPIPYPSSLSSRLTWVGTLLISLRFTNWRISSPHHDRRQPHAPLPRHHLEFILHALLRSLIGYLLLDLSSHLMSLDPYFTNPSIPLLTPPSPSCPLPPLLQPLHASPLLTLAFRASLVATQAWSLISQNYHLPMTLPAALHYLRLLPHTWSPHLWPPPFGPAKAVLTSGLRGFWSVYWHQAMRFVVAGPGEAVVDLLLGKGRGARGMRFMLLTLVAFGLSGCIHMGLVPRSPKGEVGPGRIRLLVGGFFWVQPLGMAVERWGAGAVRGWVPVGWREGRVGTWAGMAAYAVWIFGWSCVCFPLLGEAGRQMGWFGNYTVPWSALRWWMEGDGWMWDCLKEKTA